MSKLRRALAALVIGLAAALVPATAALAEPPMTLDSIVTDTTNFIGGADRQRIEAASADLEAATGGKLYFVMVNSFEQPSDANAWAVETANRSDLSDQDVLLFVNRQTRMAALNVAKELPLSAADRQQISSDIVPLIARNDFGEAAEKAVAGLKSALGANSGGGAGVGVAVGVLGVGAAVGAGVFVARRRKQAQTQQQQTKDEAEAEKAQLQEASQQLVRMDNLVRSSDEEASFAAAEFGEDEVQNYRHEIDMAKDALREGFDLQGKLLDDVPDKPEDRKAWINRILQVTQIASQRLGEQAKHFQDLRLKQDQAPQLLAALQQRQERTRPQLQPLETWVTSLAGEYDQAAIDRVRTDLTQAQQLLELADDQVESAASSLQEGKGGVAIVDITDAESTYSQFDALRQRIEDTRALFQRAPQQITDEAGRLARSLGQLQDARARSGAAGSAAEVTAVATQAQQVLDTVNAAGGVFRDPAGTLEQVQSASGQIDKQLTALLDEQEKLDHARSRMNDALRAAQEEIATAESFIATKRGALSSTPRTRLDQAQAQYGRAQAVSQSDPVQALQIANDARTLAHTALETAQQELQSAYSGFGGPFGGGYTGPGMYGNHRGGGGFGSGLGGAIIGGIIGGILSGSGSSHRYDNDWSSMGGGFGGGGGIFGGGGDGGGDWFGGAGGTR